jgi:hypothetical protein
MSRYDEQVNKPMTDAEMMAAGNDLVLVSFSIQKWARCEQCQGPATRRVCYGFKGKPGDWGPYEQEFFICHDEGCFQKQGGYFHLNGDPYGPIWAATYPLRRFPHMGLEKNRASTLTFRGLKVETLYVKRPGDDYSSPEKHFPALEEALARAAAEVACYALIWSDGPTLHHKASDALAFLADNLADGEDNDLPLLVSPGGETVWNMAEEEVIAEVA